MSGFGFPKTPTPQETAGLAWAARLEEEARRFLDSPRNAIGGRFSEKAFDYPIFGYASAADPLWTQVLNHGAGMAHWPPLTAFLEGRAKIEPRAKLAWPSHADLTVVVFALPQTEATMADQRRAKAEPAERWLRSRFAHDRVIGELTEHLRVFLESQGVEASVPESARTWKSFPHPDFQITSMWSHRHAAFVTGLGTFGLSDGLITKIGKAHRLGSLVCRLRIPPTPRAYAGPYDHCLHFAGRKCGVCVRRCPAGALSLEGGHDKTLCQNYLNFVGAQVHKYGPFDIRGAYGCGLCQSAVPCERGLPAGLPEDLRQRGVRTADWLAVHAELQREAWATARQKEDDEARRKAAGKRRKKPAADKKAPAKPAASPAKTTKTAPKTATP
ncbi:MAG: epoxyqueuosine reductase [Deltaproteobacteria bacterium]|jgi:epoxyqueuosine reductase QueG|nr:epoxyqueuosine reductase [Deltaproteobacteria bacterium]